ncbi:protein of unknown function [Massilia sp. PDC64]|nr:DUF3427 domain-containing protein [Massilia sp. PDC64]SDC80355.1 protein of unknown function [Massilia sp. PDC64]
MTVLQLFHSYTREQVHAIFSPDTVFVPQAGTWGLHGIVDVPDHPGDYVFFVTFGQAQGDHQFDEFITHDGVLSWQSQPRQGFDDRRIRDFIRHREEVNNIHLFLRPGRNRDYTYFGRLKYLDHDPMRERPVYFQWQILDWPPPEQVLAMLGRKLVPAEPNSPTSAPPANDQQTSHRLVETDAPRRRKAGRTKAEPGQPVRARRPDYVANQAANEALGLLGERLVLRIEQERLTNAGRTDLAAKIRHVSVLENDTAGYDILSFDDVGEKVFIEVKTTRGSIDSDFFISASELAFARGHSAQYRLYRLYEYLDDVDSAKFYILTGAPDDHKQLSLAPTNFKVSMRREEE